MTDLIQHPEAGPFELALTAFGAKLKTLASQYEALSINGDGAAKLDAVVATLADLQTVAGNIRNIGAPQ